MVRFTYRIEEHGWATAQISDGVNSLDLRPSLVEGDVIESLAERVVALLKMDREGVSTRLKSSWEAEPGEYRWVLENQSGKLRVDILWFDKSWSHLGDEKGQLLFSTECSLLKFAIQVKTALREALETLGPDEYKKRAGRDFPQRTYDELKTLIRSEQLEAKSSYKGT